MTAMYSSVPTFPAELFVFAFAVGLILAAVWNMMDV